MRVSMKWLNELVQIGMPAEELAERLDMTGTAVEAIERVGGGLEGVVVGRVLTKDRHPNADTLWVTTVDVGGEEPLHIVCGAQNFEAGDAVAVAKVGSTLPCGMTIKKAKLRGEISEGMNCSAAELGLGDDHAGILILPPDAPVGMAFSEYQGSSDMVLELEVTPNRPDCLSMAGVAREVGAILGVASTVPSSVPEEAGEPTADSVRVTIEDADLCPRYTARLIRGVRIGPSPEWLVERVTAAGARPVNNVVDITNYVMFELGQPLHAFDARTLGTDADGRAHIVVRRARGEETLTTLDGQDRRLTTDMLAICDPKGPVALAGVMGGEATEISETTVDILLESAAFDADCTSHTSRSLGLISEASMRFERGVDPNGCVAAADRAASLMAQVCGGEVAPGVVDEYPRPAAPRDVELRVSRLEAVLGAEVGASECAGILSRLGLAVERVGGRLHVAVPTFRPDLEREVDLIEEVVRVWGMDRVRATLPASAARVGRLTEQQRWRERISSTVRAAGLNETMTYAFSDPKDLDRFGWKPAEGEVLCTLLNPMSEEQAVLRRTLVPGLLRSVSYNQRRGVGNVHLYEMGSVFWTAVGRKLPSERTMLAGVLAGRWREPSWYDPAPGSEPDDLRRSDLNFFDGKGVIEAVTNDLGAERIGMRAAEMPWLQPGRSAEVTVGRGVAGWLGEVHPRVLEAFEARGPVVAFELVVDDLLAASVALKPYSEIPRFPSAALDIALVVDESVTAQEVERALRSAGGKLLADVRLFDVYRGAGVPQGKKSFAFALEYRAADRTLSDEDVRPTHEKLLRKVAAAVDAELRS